MFVILNSSIVTANILLFFIIFKTQYRSKSGRAFLSLILVITIWITVVTLETALPFSAMRTSSLTKLDFALGSCISLALFLFTQYFANEAYHLPRKLNIGVIVGCCAFILLNFTDFIIKYTSTENGNIAVTTGLLFPFYAGFLILVVLGSFFILYKKLTLSIGLQRAQIKLIFTSLLIFSLFVISFSLLLPRFFDPNLSNYSIFGLLGFILVTTYAIIRYRLFNIQIQLQKTVNTLIPIIISTTLTVLLAYILYQYVEWTGERNGIILLIFYTLSYKFFNYFFTKTKLSYLLFRRTYRFHQSLIEFSNRASDITHFDTLIKELQQVFLKDNFVHKFAFFVITNQDKKSCHVYETHDINPAELAICSESILHPDLHCELTTTREPLVIDELIYSAKPVLRELKKAFLPLEGGVCIPLFVSNDLAGLVLLGPKEYNGAYTVEDIKVFQQISTPLAVAVTKSLLFTHYRDQVIELSRDKHNLEESIVDLKRMKNEFLTIVDHQFNTPLSIIESAFAMIQDGDVPLGEIREYVMSMAPRIKEFKQIVDDILRAAHFEGTGTDLKFSLVSPCETLFTQIELLQPFANEQEAPITFACPEKLPRVTTDPEQFKAALEHVLRNALIYGKGHPIEVSAVLTAEQRVHISVTDHGRGFTTEESSHFGEKFFRGKGTVDYLANGSGLGLFIAKKIIEASGGTLSWKSEGVGKGSTFVIELPKGSEFVKTRSVIPE